MPYTKDHPYNLVRVVIFQHLQEDRVGVTYVQVFQVSERAKTFGDEKGGKFYPLGWGKSEPESIKKPRAS